VQSLLERYAPKNACFGCGPANAHGLQIKSFVSGEELVADWRPQPHHQAFDGILNGGICWAATWHLMQKPVRRRRRAP